jgi:hypothetical protein
MTSGQQIIFRNLGIEKLKGEKRSKMKKGIKGGKELISACISFYNKEDR